MRLRSYCLYDEKSLIFHSPFFAVTDGAATRSVADLVTDPATTVGRHPGDYKLYCVGEFDDAKGAMIPVSPIIHVVDAVSLVPQVPPLPLEK